MIFKVPSSQIIPRFHRHGIPADSKHTRTRLQPRAVSVTRLSLALCALFGTTPGTARAGSGEQRDGRSERAFPAPAAVRAIVCGPPTGLASSSPVLAPSCVPSHGFPGPEPALIPGIGGECARADRAAGPRDLRQPASRSSVESRGKVFS